MMGDEGEDGATYTMRIRADAFPFFLQSMTGRIVMSSYETLRAAGTNVICLSPVSEYASRAYRRLFGLFDLPLISLSFFLCFPSIMIHHLLDANRLRTGSA